MLDFDIPFVYVLLNDQHTGHRFAMAMALFFKENLGETKLGEKDLSGRTII